MANKTPINSKIVTNDMLALTVSVAHRCLVIFALLNGAGSLISVCKHLNARLLLLLFLLLLCRHSSL